MKRRRNIELETQKHRCKVTEGAVKVLSNDVKWEYSAPSIPNSHWIEQGHGELYAEGLLVYELFLRQMKNMTCAMRDGVGVYAEEYGKCGRNFTLGIRDLRYGRHRHPIIIHDKLMIPHWKELADAIGLHRGFNGYGVLTICNTQLHHMVMDMLVTAFKGKRFEELRLDMNDFGSPHDGITFAIRMTQNISWLQRFLWANTSINTSEDAHRLIESIAEHETIETIRLRNCCQGDMNGYDLLCLLLELYTRIEIDSLDENFLRTVDLGMNCIRTMGQTHLPDFLATNPPLSELHLEHNKLDDKDALLIASALKQNTHLTHLFLEGNDFTEVGRQSLCDAVFDSTSLNAAASSNHTCFVGEVKGQSIGIRYGLFDGHRFSIDNDPHDQSLNRGTKIYSMLLSRNEEGSNAQHLDVEFGDDSIKVAPKVLEAVHSLHSLHLRKLGRWVRRKRHRLPTSLSITFEILRDWLVTELCECNQRKSSTS